MKPTKLGWIALAAAITHLCGSAGAAENAPRFWQWAPTPPMGWNSWDCFGCTVTEDLTKANADYMAAHLAPHGWQYIVVDIQWYEPQSRGFDYSSNPKVTMDEWGRLWPVPKKFPSAAEGKGFKPLADYVHAKGLKFGLHLLRGIPRAAVDQNTSILGTTHRAADVADRNSKCDWNPDMYGVDMSKPGAQEYYNSVFRLLAQWGVDYVKVDDLSQPYHAAEIEGIRRAIDACGRPIVFSTSPGDTPLADGAHVSTNANLWRISGDFWDDWRALKAQFDRLDKWTRFRGPGHWPDADMLPLGNVRAVEASGWTRFTETEQVTLMTLWSIARSPLMMGGHLPKNDAFTLSLLTNDEMLQVNQASRNNRQVFRDNDLIGWMADVPDSKDKYVALFNARETGIDPSRALFKSELITRKTPGQAVDIDIDISGAKRLYLVVDDGGDGFACDHADWLEPRLIGASGERRLSDLKWEAASAGWGTPAVGKSVSGKSLIVDGKTYTDGLGTHSESVIEYALPDGYTRFRTRAGLDAGGVSQRGGATVHFMVFTIDPKPEGGVTPVKVSFADLGFSGACRVRDLWKHVDLGRFEGSYAPVLLPHSSALLRVTPE